MVVAGGSVVNVVFEMSDVRSLVDCICFFDADGADKGVCGG